MDTGNQPITKIPHSTDTQIDDSYRKRLPHDQRKQLARNEKLKNEQEGREPLPSTPWHRLDVPVPSRTSQLIKKYNDFRDRGFMVLGVTLSTEVTSNHVAASDKFASLWTKHFCEKVQRRLRKGTAKALFEHDYEIEKNDGQTCVDTKSGSFWQRGFWHFHGEIAVHPSVAHRIWNDDCLNRHLINDLKSFASMGKYRPFRVTSFKMEPIRSVEDWIRYTRKATQPKVEIH